MEVRPTTTERAVVIGTAGHIDHGKTTLLRALTGIDADRLPEERQRGMTIDVGYAHLVLEGGDVLDFVDVPGHDRLVGNMLVGAGEVDAALLVVAADDGPRAQTLEHLELLDGLGLADGVAAVTKADAVADDRLAEVVDAVGRLLDGTTLAGAPIVPVSAVAGTGLYDLRRALAGLRDRVAGGFGGAAPGPPRLAIDRVFAMRGHGTVVTGSLRGGALDRGATVRIEPGGFVARVRGLEVHGEPAERVDRGGRTALNVTGVEASQLRRGMVVTVGAGVELSDRLLVALRPPPGRSMLAQASRGSRGSVRAGWPPADGARVRLHLGTEAVDARIGRSGRDAVELPDGRAVAILRLAGPVAVGIGDRFVLRRPSPGEAVAGGTVLDPFPPRGVARRRTTPERLASLAEAVSESDGAAAADALVALHGALPMERVEAVTAVLGAASADGRLASADGRLASADGRADRSGGLVLAADVAELLDQRALDLVVAYAAESPLSEGLLLAQLRPAVATTLRRLTGAAGPAAFGAADGTIDRLVARGRLARDRDRLRDPNREPGLPPALAAAMDRLEAALDVASPSSLREAAVAAGCPQDGIRALEAAGRIVRLDDDLAYSAATFDRLVALAVTMSQRAPLTPAAFRDATATSRKYVMAILEDLDRRGILRRTPDGHVPGPRAPQAELPPLPRTADGGRS